MQSVWHAHRETEHEERAGVQPSTEHGDGAVRHLCSAVAEEGEAGQGGLQGTESIVMMMMMMMMMMTWTTALVGPCRQII